MASWAVLLVVSTLQVHGCLAALDVLVITSCATGHLNTVSGVARAASNRGHRIHVISMMECEGKVRERIPNLSTYTFENLHISRGIDTSNPVKMFQRAVEMFYHNLTVNAFHLFEGHLNQRRYDVVLSDFLVIAGTLAPTLNAVPVVTSYVGPTQVLYKDDDLTQVFSVIPANKREHYPILAADVIDYAVAYATYYFISAPIYEFMSDVAGKAGFDLSGLVEDLVASSFYFQYSVNIMHGSPHINLKNFSRLGDDDNLHWIGYVPDKLTSPSLSTRDGLVQFMDSSNRPIVLISMGTLLTMPEYQILEVLSGLEQQNEFSFVWAVHADQVDLLRSRQISDSSIFIGWNLPQLAVLLHHKLKMFVTHAGANSVMESIHAEKPMLLSPSWADGATNAERVVHSGTGFYLPQFSSHSILEALRAATRPVVYQALKHNLHALSRLQNSLGGFEKGVDILELTANRTITPRDMSGRIGSSLPHVKRVLSYAISLGMLITGLLLYTCVRCCCYPTCCKCCRRREKVE